MIIRIIIIIVVFECAHFSSSSTNLEPVRPDEWPPVHSRSAQCAVDQPVLQGPAAGAGPGQSILSLTGQQQN